MGYMHPTSGSFLHGRRTILDINIKSIADLTKHITMTACSLSRNRDGCLNCRSKRRKCDRQKPECRACRNVRAMCVFPTPASVSRPRKFVVVEGSQHFLIPLRQRDREVCAINLTPPELETIWDNMETGRPFNDTSQHGREGSSWSGEEVPRDNLWPQPQWWSHLGEKPHFGLLQYCEFEPPGPLA